MKQLAKNGLQNGVEFHIGRVKHKTTQTENRLLRPPVYYYLRVQSTTHKIVGNFCGVISSTELRSNTRQDKYTIDQWKLNISEPLQ